MYMDSWGTIGSHREGPLHLFQAFPVPQRFVLVACIPVLWWQMAMCGAGVTIQTSSWVMGLQHREMFQCK